MGDGGPRGRLEPGGVTTDVILAVLGAGRRGHEVAELMSPEASPPARGWLPSLCVLIWSSRRVCVCPNLSPHKEPG